LLSQSLKKNPSTLYAIATELEVSVDDLLFDGEEDVRARGFIDRRNRLSEIIDTAPHDRFDLSPLVDFSSWDELDKLRSAPPDPVIEGVMIKRRDSTYQAGRAKGPWFKWKRNPFNVDAVLMYAQRGHGKRSSYYSDFTFGVWSTTPEGEQLVPVGITVIRQKIAAAKFDGAIDQPAESLLRPVQALSVVIDVKIENDAGIVLLGPFQESVFILFYETNRAVNEIHVAPQEILAHGFHEVDQAVARHIQFGDHLRARHFGSKVMIERAVVVVEINVELMRVVPVHLAA